MNFAPTPHNAAISQNAAADDAVCDFAGRQKSGHGVDGRILVIETTQEGNESDLQPIDSVLALKEAKTMESQVSYSFCKTCAYHSNAQVQLYSSSSKHSFKYRLNAERDIVATQIRQLC